jgi:AraC family transcriptional regulator
MLGSSMSGTDRPERKALEAIHACAAADVQSASPQRGWDNIAASRFRSGRLHIDLPPQQVPVFGVNYGSAIQVGCIGQARALRFKPGHLVIAPSDVPSQWTCDRLCDVVIVCLSRDLLDGAMGESTQRDPRSIEIIPRFAIRDLVLERIAHQLLREVIRPEPGTQMRVQERAHDLAIHLLRAHSNHGRPLDRQARTIPPRKLKRVKDFICANLNQDLSLAEVAAVAEMTLFHFAKAFREATGSAPHRYLIEHRILRARTLLHDPKLSIRGIATAVGFTHSHFTRLFTRHMGMTPSAFRNLL